jgi:SMC interacting uncharacterized protein involved in chromosome segregation
MELRRGKMNEQVETIKVRYRDQTYWPTPMDQVNLDIQTLLGRIEELKSEITLKDNHIKDLLKRVDELDKIIPRKTRGSGIIEEEE